MKLVIDACSIILLSKATVLEEFTKWRDIMITNGVYNEVLEGKNKQLLDALLLERLVKEKKIIIKNNLKEEIVQKLTKDFGLGIGEAESIVLTMETENNIIITDNKQGRKIAKIQGLKLLGSIEVIIFLFKKSRISKEKTLNALKILEDQGWFQNYMIEEALEEVKNG